MQQSSVYFPGKWPFYFMRYPSHIVFNNIVVHIYMYILHLITRFIQTRIYYLIEMKPKYIWPIRVCTCVQLLNRRAMVYIHSLDTDCAHWAMYSMYATNSVQLVVLIQVRWWYVGDSVIWSLILYHNFIFKITMVLLEL